MKRLLLLATFAFVLSVALGGEYGRRGTKTVVTRSHTVVHKPTIKEPVIKKSPVHLGSHQMMDPMINPMVNPMMDPMMDPMLGGGQFGGIRDPVIRSDGTVIPLSALLGKTITGTDIIGGRTPGFALHGGAGAGENFKDGLRNGWGGNQELHQPEAVSSWVHPFDNRPFDPEFNGGRLIFDSARGMMVAEQRHNQAKATGAIVSNAVEHDIVKEANHVARKTIGGHGVGGPVMGMSHIGKPATIEHQIAKSSGGIGVIGHDPIARHSIGLSPIEHNIAKSQTMHGIGGPVIQHEAIKSTSIVGPSIHHDMAKSTNIGLGTAPIHGGMHHAMAKSSGIGIGDDIVEHNIAKTSATALNPFGEPVGMVGGHGGIRHEIAKSSGIAGLPLGHGMPVKKTGMDPVHNVEKVIRSGAARHGHDDLSVGLGNDIAREIARQSANIINVGTGGAVSMGDPTAQQAAKGLARETAHIVGETLDMASRKSSPLLGGSHLLGAGHLGGGQRLGFGGHHGAGGLIGGSLNGGLLHGGSLHRGSLHGGSLLGGKPAIHKAPKVPKVPIRSRGYGRRTRGPRRRIVRMRNW